VCAARPLFVDRAVLPRNVNVTAGESVTLRCDAYAEPPANISWMSNARLLDRMYYVSFPFFSSIVEKMVMKLLYVSI